jgi:Icc-related predicted phosphoesterase
VIIQAISDTHLRHHELNIKPCDVFVHSGDFTEWGTANEVMGFFEWLATVDAPHKIVTPGNHDTWCESEIGMIWCRKFCKDNNINLLINESVNIDGIRFWGSPITPYISQSFAWGKYSTVQEAADNEGEWIGKYWNMIPDVDVIITHGPAYKILDKGYYSGLHYGCKWLKKRIVELKPKAHIFGHVHAGRGMIKKSGTQRVNAAQIWEKGEVDPFVFTI